jgi:hypothetical protein
MPKVNLNKYQPVDLENEFYWYSSSYDQHYDDFDDLPTRENRAANLARRYGDMWNVMDYRNYKNPSPWKIADRILSKNIGKSFNLAFSYYCKQVRPHEQKIFLENVSLNIRRYRSCSEYSIDDNGLIQYEPFVWGWRKNKEITFDSPDYKTTLVHKITGHNINEFKSVYKPIKPVNKYSERRQLSHYEYGNSDNHRNIKSKKERYIAYKDDFVTKVISGYSLKFSSKNDHLYKKLSTERLKSKILAERKAKLAKRNFDYSIIIKDNTLKCLMSKEEFKRKQLEAKRREEELNLIKIISHGFDPKTSFRND